MRVRIAQEAARLMSDHGIRDYYTAKQKAAARLGATGTHNLPRNSEIETARMEYQQLFHPHEQPLQLRQLRSTALQAMQLLALFEPRLVGPVLTGSADQYDAIILHLFTDTPEEVAFTLMQQDIPFTSKEYHLHLGGEEKPFPGYCFVAGETDINLVIFPAIAIRHAPSSPVDGRPMHRAALHEVERLLESEGESAADTVATS